MPKQTTISSRLGQLWHSREVDEAQPPEQVASDIADPLAQSGDAIAISHGYFGDAVDLAAELRGQRAVVGPATSGPARLDGAEVRILDDGVALHDSWGDTPLAEAMVGGQLDLNRLSPELFVRLDPKQRSVLLRLLSRVDVTVQRPVAEGEGDERPLLSRLFNPVSIQTVSPGVQRDLEDGATALARKIFAAGDNGAFAAVFAAAPDKVLPMVRGDAARVLSVSQMSRVLNEMRRTENALGVLGYSGDELAALGDLFARYLEENAGHSKESLETALVNLYLGIEKSLPADTGPRTTGIIAGALVAGVYKYLDTAHGMHSRKIRRLNEFATLSWASSGVIALAGGQVGLLAAGGAAALVTFAVRKSSGAIDTARKEFRNRVQGELQLHLLQGAENMTDTHPDPSRPMLPKAWESYDGGYRGAADTALHWISATLKNNSLD